MKKYNSYKDSGIEWLGYKPEHWSNNRIDWITSFVRGNTGLKKDELLEVGEYVALQYGKTYKVDEVDNSFNFFVNSEFYKRNQTVKRGDTILISTSETIEDLGHSCFYNREEIGLIGGEQILLKPKTKLINEKYLYYFSKIFCGELRKYATGLKVFRFNTDDLKKVFIAVPTPEEQTAIAQYLDTKTQAIDKKINLLTIKADHHKELRKSIINDAVCKGLDKNVKLKESGIEWIGKIPEHWNVERLKAFAKTIKGRNLEFFDKPFEKSLPILSLDYLRNENVEFVNYCYTKDKSQLVDENDFIIIWDGAGVGEILKGKKGFISSTTAKFVFNKKMYSKFFFHLRDSIEYTLKQIPTGMGIPHLNPQVLNNFPCPVPPKEEQTAIAKYLDEKTQKIDAIVSNIGKQIDTLKELRKTLINDVVTGKIKVVNN